MHGLNPAQTDAVLHRGSSLLVLAGAGSGKTRVVTTRIAKLLIEGVAPENIVGVTFTNKAAKEMRERLIGLVGSERCQGISLSTFHSFCIRVLREHGTHVGLKSFFAIADTADQVAQVIAAAGKYSSVFKSFPPDKCSPRFHCSKIKVGSPTKCPTPPQSCKASHKVFTRSTNKTLKPCNWWTLMTSFCSPRIAPRQSRGTANPPRSNSSFADR